MSKVKENKPKKKQMTKEIEKAFQSLKPIRWYNLKDKEPGDGVILLYNHGYPTFVQYLPPRRGREFGDWLFEEGEEESAKGSDVWLDFDYLNFAISIDGLVEFIPKLIER